MRRTLLFLSIFSYFGNLISQVTIEQIIDELKIAKKDAVQLFNEANKMQLQCDKGWNPYYHILPSMIRQMGLRKRL